MLLGKLYYILKKIRLGYLLSCKSNLSNNNSGNYCQWLLAEYLDNNVKLFLPKLLPNKIVVQPNVHTVIKTWVADPGEDDLDPDPTLEKKKNRVRIRPPKINRFDEPKNQTSY